MRALCLLRDGPAYRRDRFVAGLQAAGYAVRDSIGTPGPGDVLLCWNRYGHYDDEARRFEQAGASVLVAENSYLAGATSIKAHALARSYHNDAEVVRDDGPERWNALAVDLKPWRADGGHVLVCPNRSFGTPGRIMPVGWGEEVSARLGKMTKREIRLRPHPGNKPPVKPLADDLAGAWAVCIWASSAGVHALLAGVPVFVASPSWILKGCDAGPFSEIEKPVMPDRLPHFQRLAWANFTVEEIASGFAFDVLLKGKIDGPNQRVNADPALTTP